jgi:leader peptidase (prepilin peptidase)/N-methyltransferase
MILIKEKEDLVEYSIFILGLVFGSFLNVLIFRLAHNVSLINPKRSFCPNCNYQIKWYENIPVISYIFLKASCSNCSKHISIRYFIVELLTAFITLLLYVKFGRSTEFLMLVILTYILIVLSFIDFEFQEVPDYLLILVVLVAFTTINFNIFNALVFAGAFTLLELFVTFYIQNIKYRFTKDESLLEQKSLGEGDIPIVAIIGGLLNIKLGIIAIILAALLAIIPAMYNLIFKKETQTAFIPFLSLGLLIVLLFDNLFLKVIF